MGANSILIEQARHFSLLVGNYSRDHFHHPGPAYMYVQAAGESLFWAWLHVVPSAWNGQLLAVYALNAMFVALAVGAVYGRTGSLRGAAVCFAAVVALASAHPAVLSSDWMPYLYVVAYITFLVAAASVAAGRVRDAWILALTGWFLIHGHACFLFFVPVICLAALVAVLWPRRHGLGAALRSFFATQRRVWVPVAVISAAFAFPIVADLVLHWPGQFGGYLAYMSSRQAGGHSLAAGDAGRAVVLVAAPERMGGPGGRIRGRCGDQQVARPGSAAPVPDRPARRRRGVIAGVPLLRRDRDRQALSITTSAISTGRLRSSCFWSSCWA